MNQQSKNERSVEAQKRTIQETVQARGFPGPIIYEDGDARTEQVHNDIEQKERNDRHNQTQQ